MTIETLQKANDLQNRINDLKGIGFNKRPDYDYIQQYADFVTIKADNHNLQFELYHYPELKDIICSFVKYHKESIDKRIAELEQELAAL